MKVPSLDSTLPVIGNCFNFTLANSPIFCATTYVYEKKDVAGGPGSR